MMLFFGRVAWIATVFGMFLSGWRRTAVNGRIIPLVGHGPDLAASYFPAERARVDPMVALRVE
jgi:hypothetical protein